MPTQEELNAAQVELDIANDNYAALADRYNRYQKLFQEYANASPEIKQRATEAMGRALEDYYQLQDRMRAAEDRIAVAQNTVNSYNEIMAQQPTVKQSTPTTRRRQYPNNYFGGEGWVKQNGTLTSPDGLTKIYSDGSISFGDGNDSLNNGWKPVYNNKGEIVGEQKITPNYQIGAHPTQTIEQINPTLDRLSEQQYVRNYRTQPNINPGIVNTNLGLSGNISAAPAVPYEIQNVRGLRGDAYLQGLNNLQNNYGYNVVGQRAYRNGNSYRTY